MMNSVLNNATVSNHFADVGKMVEFGSKSLPPEEYANKVERRLVSAEKKSLKNPDRLDNGEEDNE